MPPVTCPAPLVRLASARTTPKRIHLEIHPLTELGPPGSRPMRSRRGMGPLVSSRVRTGSLGAAAQGEAAATTLLVCLSAWTCPVSATLCPHRTEAKKRERRKEEPKGMDDTLMSYERIRQQCSTSRIFLLKNISIL